MNFYLAFPSEIKTLDRRIFNGGSQPDWFLVTEKGIIFLDDCLESPSEQFYQFSTPVLKDPQVLIRPSEIYIIARDTNTSGTEYLWNLRVNPSTGVIIENRKIRLSPDRLFSIQFNPNNNQISFGVFHSGSAGYVIDSLDNKFLYINETNAIYDYLAFVFASNNEYEIFK